MPKHKLADLMTLVGTQQITLRPTFLPVGDTPVVSDDPLDADLTTMLSPAERRMVFEERVAFMLDSLVNECLILHRTSRRTKHYGKRIAILTAVFRVWSYACVTPTQYRAMVCDTDPEAPLMRLRRLIDVPETNDGLFN